MPEYVIIWGCTHHTKLYDIEYRAWESRHTHIMPGEKYYLDSSTSCYSYKEHEKSDRAYVKLMSIQIFWATCKSAMHTHTQIHNLKF